MHSGQRRLNLYTCMGPDGKRLMFNYRNVTRNVSECHGLGNMYVCFIKSTYQMVNDFTILML